MKNDEYLKKNEEHWQQGCPSENVESHVFRPYGIILRDELGLTGEKNERLLDFGCGEGTATNFFKHKGFDVHGVDINLPDLDRCKEKMPEIRDQFLAIDPEPNEDDVFFGGNFDLIIAIHSMYYYTNTQLKTRLKSLHNMLNPGGIIYVTMIGEQSRQFQFAESEGDGLYKVSLPTFNRPRLKEAYKPHFKNFTKDRDDLIEKFSVFKKLYTGHFEESYADADDGPAHVNHVFHYTFIGQKEKI